MNYSRMMINFENVLSKCAMHVTSNWIRKILSMTRKSIQTNKVIPENGLISALMQTADKDHPGCSFKQITDLTHSSMQSVQTACASSSNNEDDDQHVKHKYYVLCSKFKPGSFNPFNMTDAQCEAELNKLSPDGPEVTKKPHFNVYFGIYQHIFR